LSDGRAHARIAANSKHCERRVARAWGSDRHINHGRAHSDSREDCPVSLEVTRRKNGWPSATKLKQAQTNAEAEGRPYVLVVGRPGQRVPDMVAVVNHGWLLDVCRRAGVIA
jgi:hypothetical protein